MQGSLIDLVDAHDELMPIFQVVPDESLDWRPGEDEFSIKQLLVHLTHASDFYVMIVEEALSANFGVVRLHPELSGWQRMIVTDAEAWQCPNVALLYGSFERAFQRLLTVLESLTDEEIEHPFMLYEMQSDTEPQTTTLKSRVLYTAASHLREHQAQLSETLVRWRSTQTTL